MLANIDVDKKRKPLCIIKLQEAMPIKEYSRFFLYSWCIFSFSSVKKLCWVIELEVAMPIKETFHCWCQRYYGGPPQNSNSILKPAFRTLHFSFLCFSIMYFSICISAFVFLFLCLCFIVGAHATNAVLKRTISLTSFVLCFFYVNFIFSFVSFTENMLILCFASAADSSLERCG